MAAVDRGTIRRISDDGCLFECVLVFVYIVLRELLAMECRV